MELQACSEIPKQRKGSTPNCMQQNSRYDGGVVKIYHEMNAGRNDKAYFTNENKSAGGQSGLQEATGNPADNQLNMIMKQIQNLKTENRELRGLIKHEPDILRANYGSRHVVTSTGAHDDIHLSRHSVNSLRTDINKSDCISRSNSLKDHSHTRKYASKNQLFHGDGCNGVVNLDSRGL